MDTDTITETDSRQETKEQFKCLGCDRVPAWRWTDTHGVAACNCCGMPYQILHYEGEGDTLRPVEKPPECTVKREYIPMGREYYRTTKQPCFPASHCFDVPSYSGHSAGQVRQWKEWVAQNKHRFTEAL